MDGGNWRPAHVESNSDSNGWKAQLPVDSRSKMVNGIMETLKKTLPTCGPNELSELEQIAKRFEGRIYDVATSQNDYLLKISAKMFQMENKSPSSAVTESKCGSSSQIPSDPVKMQNQGQSLPITLPNQSQPQQQLLLHSLRNSAASVAVQNPSRMQATLASMGGLAPTSMTNALGHGTSLQSLSENSQNISSSLGEVASSNIFHSSHRARQPHPQQVGLQQQHQSQNPSQMIYAQQLPQQIFNQKLQGSSSQSLLQQSHMPQQSLLQTNQMQASHPSLMQQISSGLQSVPTGLPQQPSMMQSNLQPGLQQNQRPSVQQSVSSGLQQLPTPVTRQQQQSQQPPMHQKQASILQQQQTPSSQQPLLSSQTQQQLMRQQQSDINRQQNQLLGQQNNISDMQQQQQRTVGQQNNLSNMEQQQQQRIVGQHNSLSHMEQQQQQQRTAGQQNNLSHMEQQQQHQQSMGQHSNSNLQQQQQQQLSPLITASVIQQHQLDPQNTPGLQLQQKQLLGPQSGMLNLQQQHQQSSVHIVQPAKVSTQQQPTPQTSTPLLSHVQRLQPQPTQQQLLSRPMPGQLLQHLALQQPPPNLLHREMQQMMQTSGDSLQSQNAIEQQKQPFQHQRALPESLSTSMDSTAETGHTATVAADWQEEVYQKIQSMKELYLPELNEIYQRAFLKFRQQPGQPDQIGKLKQYKAFLDHITAFVQISKSNISPAEKEKLSSIEKQIMTVLSSHRFKKPALKQQGQHQLQPSGGQSVTILQGSQSQVTQQQQQHDNRANQMQPISTQGPISSIQSTSTTNMHHGSMPLPTQSGLSIMQQNMANTCQTSFGLDSGAQGSSQSSLPQGVRGTLQQNVGGSLQQSNANVQLQQTNNNALSQGGVNTLLPNVNLLKLNSNMLQQQHAKQQQQQQEQQLVQSQQLKQQYPHHHVVQQLIQQQQKQPILQLQQLKLHQLQQQQKQQQSAQLQANQMPQLHQMDEVNELKVSASAAIGMAMFQQHQQVGQRPAYQQQVKMGSQFPISSPQLLQSVPPQISQHSSPQPDQKSLPLSLQKSATPLHSVNTLISVHSPSTPLTPSSLRGDPEKPLPGISSISNVGNVGQQPASFGPKQVQPLMTSGMSPSLFLQEPTTDGNQGNNASATEQPLERLIKMVQSMSPQAFSSSIIDIGSVVSMIDGIAGSSPGNGSRAAVGEDLMAMTKCRLQARNFISQDAIAVTKKMRRETSAISLKPVPSVGSVNNSFKRFNSPETSELESTATSRIKRHRVEISHGLLEEIREINQHLIDTVVEICDEDAHSTAAAAGGEGTVIKCSFSAVAICPNLKLQYDSAQMSPISPLHLLIPTDYPNCSPIVLDELAIEPSKEFEDLSAKAKSRFNIYLRSHLQPMSLGEVARIWHICARTVIAEYAQQSGGGSFSSRYGAWQNCVSA